MSLDESPALQEEVEEGRTTTSPQVLRTRLSLTRVEPWSVLKTVFPFMVLFHAALVGAVALTWTLLVAAGLVADLDDLLLGLLGSEAFTVSKYVTLEKLTGVSTLVAVASTMATSALAVLAAGLYNLIAPLMGGIEATYSTRDH